VISIIYQNASQSAQYGFLLIFSVRSVMHKYLEKKSEVNFDKIFNQRLGKLIIECSVKKKPCW